MAYVRNRERGVSGNGIIFATPTSHELLPIHHDGSFCWIRVVFNTVDTECNLFHKVFQGRKAVSAGAGMVFSIPEWT